MYYFSNDLVTLHRVNDEMSLPWTSVHVYAVGYCTFSKAVKIFVHILYDSEVRDSIHNEFTMTYTYGMYTYM